MFMKYFFARTKVRHILDITKQMAKNVENFFFRFIFIYFVARKHTIYMKKEFIGLLLILEGVCMNVSSQEFVWKAGVYNFFENTEFANSTIQIPQTMAGVHLAPEAGLTWNDNHRVSAGFDAMHEYGSDKAVDFFDPIVYYEFTGKRFRFYAGAFPRKSVLDKYPRMFFQDSIQNYRPVVNGIFWEYHSGRNYMNVWLDWISRQTYTRREAFFLGWSGRYNFTVFYGQHFGYMLHFYHVKNPQTPEGLRDNILTLTCLGIDLSGRTQFEKLEANVGWAVGLERNRNIGTWHRPHGLLSEIKVEYKGLELYNTYYRGQSQQVFHNDHISELYWGDPMYRTKEYNRSDLSIWFYKSQAVNLKMTWSLHFAEQTLYHAQLFTATFELDNLKKNSSPKYRYIWDGWFQ
jgi:hypothetical protein